MRSQQGRSQWFCFPFCRWRENGVPTIPIKSPSILAFFRLGLGREMGPTNQPQQMCMPHRRGPPSTFSVFIRGRHRPPNSPGHRRSRPRGSPRHDFHRVSPLHRGCEYSKAFDVLGPKILLWTIKDSVYPTLLCLSAASSRVCNEGQRPNTEGWYKPTWEGPAPCNTASETSSSRAIWGKASPTRPLLAGTQTSPSWFHPGLQRFSKVKLASPRLISTSSLQNTILHTYRILWGLNHLQRFKKGLLRKVAPDYITWPPECFRSNHCRWKHVMLDSKVRQQTRQWSGSHDTLEITHERKITLV